MAQQEDEQETDVRGLHSDYVVPCLDQYLKDSTIHIETLPGYFQLTKVVQPSIRGQLPVVFVSDGVRGIQATLKLNDQLIGVNLKDGDLVNICTSTGHPNTGNLIIVSPIY